MLAVRSLLLGSGQDVKRVVRGPHASGLRGRDGDDDDDDDDDDDNDNNNNNNNNTDKWYTHVPKPVYEEGDVTVLWNQIGQI